MTTTDAATRLADTILGADHAQHAALVAWLTANRQLLLSDVANGTTDIDTAARMVIHEAHVNLRAIVDAVRAATPPRKAA